MDIEPTSVDAGSVSLLADGVASGKVARAGKWMMILSASRWQRDSAMRAKEISAERVRLKVVSDCKESDFAMDRAVLRQDARNDAIRRNARMWVRIWDR